MVAEIKIVGADYAPKMQWFIADNVARLRRLPKDIERYMILVIPESKKQTNLGKYLDEISFSDNCRKREWPGFRVRIWRV